MRILFRILPVLLVAVPLVAQARPTLSITGERYVRPRVYLLSGILTDGEGSMRLIYRIRKVETVVRLGSRRNWRIRLRLKTPRTRLVFYAMDRNGVRSPRQKRIITPQAGDNSQTEQSE